MTANHRREKIFELIKEDGSAKVVNLAKIFKVTEPTIRQDLEKLEEDGMVIREHGGAYLKNVDFNVSTVSLANQEHIDKKGFDKADNLPAPVKQKLYDLMVVKGGVAPY